MVCKPKKEGGLGIGKTAHMNTALLSKLGWKLECKDESLWARVISSKYLKGESFLNSCLKSVASPTWRSIYSTKDLVKQGCVKLVSNVRNTSFWFDKWIGPKTVEQWGIDVPFHMRNDTVSDYANQNGWDPNVLTLLPVDLQQQLSLVHLTEHEEDRIYWMVSSDGDFSVKSAYNLLIQGEVRIDN